MFDEPDPVDEEFPLGWEARDYQTVGDGLVRRWKPPGIQGPEVSASRNGVMISSVMVESAADLDGLRALLDVAEATADQLRGSRGDWQPRTQVDG